mmetsp:Transcript_57932/g.154380  ORF Transcript_57932/g.154380 Transcript_57932/m.154380 type:complete len:193 (+) Transcript_57932:1064-1642(+)
MVDDIVPFAVSTRASRSACRLIARNTIFALCAHRSLNSPLNNAESDVRHEGLACEGRGLHVPVPTRPSSESRKCDAHDACDIPNASKACNPGEVGDTGDANEANDAGRVGDTTDVCDAADAGGPRDAAADAPDGANDTGDEGDAADASGPKDAAEGAPDGAGGASHEGRASDALDAAVEVGAGEMCDTGGCS